MATDNLDLTRESVHTDPEHALEFRLTHLASGLTIETEVTSPIGFAHDAPEIWEKGRTVQVVIYRVVWGVAPEWIVREVFQDALGHAARLILSGATAGSFRSSQRGQDFEFSLV